MRHVTAITSCICGLLLVCLPVAAAQTSQGSAAAQAKEIIDVSGVRGGIVVHLGCGDGKLTAALRANDSYTVHGLEADAGKVEQARKYIQEQGVYGNVSVEQHSGPALPYTDNLVNLIVVENARQVPTDEVMRVLAPGGVACVQRGGKWQKETKARPGDIDEWTHFLHDASNNAVANDSVVGMPRSLQWVAPPLWLRSHETPSGIESAVSAGGRVFYFFDEGLIGITDERLPDRWSLICRDAFNGKLLWKRPLEAWGWREWNPARWEGKDWTTITGGRTDVPNENQRRIVTDGERVYTTISYRAPMSILDAATGKVIATVKETQNASEILFSNGVVLVNTQEPSEGPARRRGAKDTGAGALVAVNGQTGRVLWEKQTGQIRPLMLAINNGRIVYLGGKELVARDLKDGRELWSVQPKQNAPKTLVSADGVVVMQGGKLVAAHDAADGKLLWEKTVPPIGGGEGDDLFVIDGLVWRGMLTVNDDGEPVGKSPNALVIGWDLRSGEEKKRILVKNLRSPEHHHRCYRNKATTRYLIGSYEGTEFLDFQGDNHGQNNWLRGACRYGMLPCNGLLYVPADQCFCEPGAKLLGFTAVKAAPAAPLKEVADERRLEKGAAYGQVRGTRDEGRETNEGPSATSLRDKLGTPALPRRDGLDGVLGDWPTFRHDPARSGATSSSVPADVSVAWKAELKGRLTAPVACGGKVFVAKADTHTVYALDAKTGQVLWQFTTGGRIDSPPTIQDDMVLFGSADGRVYCVRASDGKLVWRFLAAPSDRRIACFDQIESVWPVHGSVLMHEGVAYFTSGRSTYLDGGIRVYGLDPATGKILHKGLLEGPHRQVDGERDLGFFVPGANSDVLVSEGGYLYMRQKKITPDLKEIKPDVLSVKGEQDVGMHVFSTSGLLDNSWYNRTFWMYSKRWPGFQLANQAPKSGQLLVVDDQRTYAVSVFYRRNVHTTMFFPAKEGYLLFADLNTTEPQIVGEQGARKPLAWLPQSGYDRGSGRGIWTLDREAFGLDKMIGYTRADPPVWTHWLPVRIRAMVKAGDNLYVAGPPDVLDQKDPYAAFEGRKRARLVAVSGKDGAKLSEIELESTPVFDGMIAAAGRLFACLEDGSVVALAGK